MKIKLSPELLWLCPIVVPNLIRVGRKQDGGYIVPKFIIDYSQGLLSFGLGNDWSFEEHWRQIKPDDPIHMYDGDPWLKYNDILKKKCCEFFNSDKNVWYQEHVVAENNLQQHQINFKTTIDRICLDRIFLKCDIEGGEIPIISDILLNHHKIIGIAIELHNINQQRQIFINTVNNIKNHYSIVHIHGNNHRSRGEEGLTDSFELTFVRNDLIHNSDLRFNIWLEGTDYSNVPDGEDLQYSFEIKK